MGEGECSVSVVGVWVFERWGMHAVGERLEKSRKKCRNKKGNKKRSTETKWTGCMCVVGRCR